MKKIILIVLLMLSLALFQSRAFAAGDQTEETETDQEIWQFDQLDNQQPQPPGPAPGGFRQGPGPGCQMGQGNPQCERMPGAGFPGMPGRRERQEWQSYSDDSMSPEYLERLQDFLSVHEPSLAAVLTELRESNPERFERSMSTIVRHYGPIMEQMEHDPDMAEISLRKTRLTLEVEQALRFVREAAEKENQQEIAETTELLHGKVAQLYDLIMEQQRLELDRTVERFEGMQQWRTLLEQRMAEQEPQEDRSPAMPGGGFPGMPDRHRENWGQRRCQEMERRIDQRREQLENWTQNAESIIDSRVQQLITGGEPFPW